MSFINQTTEVENTGEEVGVAAADTRLRTKLFMEVAPVRVLGFLTFTTFLLTALSVIAHALSFVWGQESIAELARLFNLGDERNVPTWFFSILLFATSVLCVFLGLQYQVRGRRRRAWYGLAFVFLFLSIDATATIHDVTLELPLVDVFRPEGVLAFPWVVAGWVLITLFTLIYFRFWWNLPPRTRMLVLIAGVLAVTGGLALEMVSAYLMDQHVEAILLRGFVATIQELAEMMGIVLFVYALLDHAGRLQKAGI